MKETPCVVQRQATHQSLSLPSPPTTHTNTWKWSQKLWSTTMSPVSEKTSWTS